MLNNINPHGVNIFDKSLLKHKMIRMFLFRQMKLLSDISSDKLLHSIQFILILNSGLLIILIVISYYIISGNRGKFVMISSMRCLEPLFTLLIISSSSSKKYSQYFVSKIEHRSKQVKNCKGIYYSYSEILWFATYDQLRDFRSNNHRNS